MNGTRTLAPVRALARAEEERSPPAAEAEAALRAAVEEITGLDQEIEALSSELAFFSRRYDAQLREAYEDLALAERLVRRVRGLEEELAALAHRLRSGEPAPATRTGRRSKAAAAARRSAQGGRAGRAGEDDARPAEEEAGEAPAAAQPEVEPAEVVLKRLYRRLARVLHPDLAQDDAERARLHDLMAKANAAYAKGDLTALEVMAEKLGAGEPLDDLSPEERLAHLARRTATIERIGASLRRERDRLVRSDTHRLREEARRREAEGKDWFEETRAELAEETAAAYADALARLARLAATAQDLSRARTKAMREIEKRGPTGARRAFDPLQEAEIVRMGAARLDRSRATPEARELARTLEAAEPWTAALALLAFFAEDSGGRPPEALSTADRWAGVWEKLRGTWEGAPDLGRVLARLPPYLVLGAREQGGAVVAGVQLAAGDLVAGVRISMERESVAEIARAVLRSLGPEEECDRCGERGPALHLLRTRGLDELNGLACSRCGAVLRSYWRYGEADGLEALAPHALRLGLVAEATAQLAGTAIGFQMLPAEREALTADRLRRRFAELYIGPYEVDLPKDAIGVTDGGERLGPSARIAAGAELELTVADGAAVTAGELLELLRARIERRFRP